MENSSNFSTKPERNDGTHPERHARPHGLIRELVFGVRIRPLRPGRIAVGRLVDRSSAASQMIPRRQGRLVDVHDEAGALRASGKNGRRAAGVEGQRADHEADCFACTSTVSSCSEDKSGSGARVDRVRFVTPPPWILPASWRKTGLSAELTRHPIST